MLINPHTNLLYQWKQKQSLLDQLQSIANLPVTSLSLQRDTVEKQFSDFVFQNSIDCLLGGLVVNGHKERLIFSRQPYYKPAITNIYLAELLIAADQVFYHGSFSFIGKQIVQYFICQISNSKLLDVDRYTDLKNSDYFFNHSTLQDLLEDKEIRLLLALTSSSSNRKSSSEGILLSYTRSLRDSAANIEMHYKEAQIIEFSFLNKLRNSKPDKVFTSSPIENCFDVNCELLALFSKVLVDDLEPNTAELATEMFGELYRQLNNDSNNRNGLVNLIYAGIMLLQVEFNLELAATIDKLTLQLDKEAKIEKSNERSQYQEMVIKIFQQRKKSLSSPAKIQLLFLSKQQIDLDSRLMELKAKFNPYRLVFVV